MNPKPCIVLLFSIATATAQEFETSFDGAGFGDVGWGIAERPEPGGFLVTGEQLLDTEIDSHNREAMLFVTDELGNVQKRLPLPNYMHASKVRVLPNGEFVIAGNKRGSGASILFVDGEGEILRERTNVAQRNSRPTSANDVIPTADGGFLVACREGMRGFVAKLDGELKTEWTTEPVDNLHYVKGAVQLPTGDCFMVGQQGSGKGVHIVHWNAKGEFVRDVVHRIDRSVNKGRRILANQAGNLAITGMLGSGGRGHFLFMEVSPRDLDAPLVIARIDPKQSISNYGQAMIQCRDGSYVIAGRSSKDGSHFLSVIRIDGKGAIIAGPKFFGSADRNSGEAGYDVVECRDGSIAVVGMKGTALLDGGKITDVSPSADFYLVKTRLDVARDENGPQGRR